MLLPCRVFITADMALEFCVRKNTATPMAIVQGDSLAHIEICSYEDPDFRGILFERGITMLVPGDKQGQRVSSVSDMVKMFTDDPLIQNNPPSYVILDFMDYRIKMQDFCNEVKIAIDSGSAGGSASASGGWEGGSRSTCLTDDSDDPFPRKFVWFAEDDSDIYMNGHLWMQARRQARKDGHAKKA